MHRMGALRANIPRDRLIAAIARRDHGIVAFTELLGVGVRGAVARRVESGRLHRGVYAVGHKAITREGIWLAAVKACGSGAALSHQTAAQHSPMLPLTANPRPVHVTVPGSGGRRKRDGMPT